MLRRSLEGGEAERIPIGKCREDDRRIDKRGKSISEEKVRTPTGGKEGESILLEKGNKTTEWGSFPDGVSKTGICKGRVQPVEKVKKRHKGQVQ